MFLPEPKDLDAAEGREPFIIDSEEKAEWAVGVIAAIDDEIARRTYQHEKRMKELQADRDRAVSFFSPLLRAWGEEEKVKRRRQTLTLGTGDLAFKRHAEEYVIADLETAKTTARAVLPSSITEETETVVTVKFDRKAFLAHAEEKMKATGEILPGVDRKPDGEAFTIKTPKWTPPPQEASEAAE